MSTYLIINILIIIIPSSLSFERKISFYKKLGFVLNSILIVSSSFIIWDIIATERGDWGFSPNYLTGIYFFGLPIEEVLFFITVPYACIFIFETVNLYLKNHQLRINNFLIWLTSIAFFIVGFINYDKNYTFTVMIFSAVSLFMIFFLDRDLMNSSNYWITIIISYLPFLIVNYFLTSIPIVTYNNSSFSTIRITTIPLEDFFYSLSMISMWILFYNLSKKRNE
jgi:lycopene cyclase domain-containing protein